MRLMKKVLIAAAGLAITAGAIFRPEKEFHLTFGKENIGYVLGDPYLKSEWGMSDMSKGYARMDFYSPTGKGVAEIYCERGLLHPQPWYARLAARIDENTTLGLGRARMAAVIHYDDGRKDEIYDDGIDGSVEKHNTYSPMTSPWICRFQRRTSEVEQTEVALFGNGILLYGVERYDVKNRSTASHVDVYLMSSQDVVKFESVRDSAQRMYLFEKIGKGVGTVIQDWAGMPGIHAWLHSDIFGFTNEGRGHNRHGLVIKDKNGFPPFDYMKIR